MIEVIEPPYRKCGDTARFESVALGPDDKVYAIVSGGAARYVAVINTDLFIENVLSLEGSEVGPACLTGIDVDKHGSIYVTDPCAEVMVQIYDSNGLYLSGFGRHDSGFDNFSHPSSIAVMPTGEMWIVDSIRQVVSRFSPDGKFVSYIGGKGSHVGALNYPSGVATDGEDRLFVLERAGNRYQCFRIESDEEVSTTEH